MDLKDRWRKDSITVKVVKKDKTAGNKKANGKTSRSAAKRGGKP